MPKTEPVVLNETQSIDRLAPMVDGVQPDQLWTVSVQCASRFDGILTLSELVVAHSLGGAYTMAINKAKARIDAKYSWVMTPTDGRPIPLDYLDVSVRGRNVRVRTKLSTHRHKANVIEATVGEPRDV